MLQRFIVKHQRELCEVAARDSGKVPKRASGGSGNRSSVRSSGVFASLTLPSTGTSEDQRRAFANSLGLKSAGLQVLVDAVMGEILVTCEKLVWVRSQGEKYLRPEARSTSSMLLSAGSAGDSCPKLPLDDSGHSRDQHATELVKQSKFM